MNELTSAVALLEPQGASSDLLAVSTERVHTYLDNARARNTVRGYRSSFGQFRLWCEAAQLNSMPATPETIALYISAQAGRLKAATLQHHLAAIGKAHKAAGFPSPIKDNQLIAETMKGIRSVHGSAQVQKAPVLTEDLRLMLRGLPPKLLGVRDRALLLVGFAGAFRRSELVALDVSDLSFTAEGLLINLRRSKTDQGGEGRQVAIPCGSHQETCPARAMRAWLEAAAITEGAVFRPITRHGKLESTRLSDHAVAIVVKRYAEGAGLVPTSFSGHSLRAGFVTSAARAGAPERQIMRTTGHRSVEMVLKYVRQANCFADNAALTLGL